MKGKAGSEKEVEEGLSEEVVSALIPEESEEQSYICLMKTAWQENSKWTGSRQALLH